jgi:hypothetical protein
MIGTLLGAFLSGLQLAFIGLAFTSGIALAAIIGLCLFWFFRGMFEAITQKLWDRWGKP